MQQHRSSHRPTSVWLTVLVLVLVLCAVPALAQDDDLSIAEARLQAVDTVVTVTGVVRSPSGAFTSWSFDEGFLIADTTGGIYVSMAENLDLKLRNRVRVTGILQLANNLLLLVATPETVERIHEKPLLIPTGAVNDATEGSLITVAGVVTQPVVDDRPFGYRVFVDDGSGELQVYFDTSIDVRNIPWLRPGQRIQVTGMSGEYVDHYELNPRFRRDLKRLND
jgi:hypothetical protein